MHKSFRNVSWLDRNHSQYNWDKQSVHQYYFENLLLKILFICRIETLIYFGEIIDRLLSLSKSNFVFLTF